MKDFKLFTITFAIISIISFGANAETEKSLTEILNGGADFAKGASQSHKSLETIPEFSNNMVEEIKRELGNIQVDDKADNLKIQGEQERDRKISTNPDGITATMASATDVSMVTGDNCRGCNSLINHDLFVRSDKLMKDPISQFETLKNEGCKEVEDKKRKGFYRQENIEEITDEIEELRICEAPILQLNCNKTLSVKCKQTIPCDYGGITKGSVSKGISFDAGKGFLTVGTDCDNCFSGTCATFNNKVTFYLAKAEVITIFKLVHVKFDDFIEIKLNDHVIYVGPHGGGYVEVKDYEVEEERERIVREPVRNPIGMVTGHRDVNQKYTEKVKKTEVFNGKEYKPCELATNWDSNVNLPKIDIDLRPFLKDGENILEMKIIVSGSGEGWLKVEARQQCCANDDWESTWEEVCE